MWENNGFIEYQNKSIRWPWWFNQETLRKEIWVHTEEFYFFWSFTKFCPYRLQNAFTCTFFHMYCDLQLHSIMLTNQRFRGVKQHPQHYSSQGCGRDVSRTHVIQGSILQSTVRNISVQCCVLLTFSFSLEKKSKSILFPEINQPIPNNNNKQVHPCINKLHCQH